MKTLLYLLLLPAFINAQTTAGERQLVALTILYDPDPTDSGRYYLISGKPSSVFLKDNQTFLLQSAWHGEGDSIVAIGAGTVQKINQDDVELNATLYPGKKVQKGDMALFLVPLDKPAIDTLFFKMARLNIIFKTVEDSNFYQRDKMLKEPVSYPTTHLLDAMAKDIRYTGDAMTSLGNDQDQEIKKGLYKGEKLFTMMKKTTGADVMRFIQYVYARPDKYKSHDWKVSETYATWVIAGAPPGR